MSSATESCGCGAKVTFNDANGDAVLGKRLAEWRTTHRHEIAAPIVEDPAPEHHPEGNNFASTDRRGESDRNHALNANDRPGHYGRAISLKWHPHE